LFLDNKLIIYLIFNKKIMSYFSAFSMGIIVGIYLEQTYKLPDVKTVVDKSKEYLKSIEKK